MVNWYFRPCFNLKHMGPLFEIIRSINNENESPYLNDRILEFLGGHRGDFYICFGHQDEIFGGEAHLTSCYAIFSKYWWPGEGRGMLRLHYIGVRKSAQNQGLGTALMRELMDRDSTLQGMQLSSRFATLEFYEKFARKENHLFWRQAQPSGKYAPPIAGDKYRVEIVRREGVTYFIVNK